MAGCLTLRHVCLGVFCLLVAKCYVCPMHVFQHLYCLLVYLCLFMYIDKLFMPETLQSKSVLLTFCVSLCFMFFAYLLPTPCTLRTYIYMYV